MLGKMNDKNFDINQVRNIEQEILDVIVDFCDKNNIKYSLGYGTLIGAIRHKGFIPWDDDIDLIMPRDDYERLKALWNNQEYYLHDYYIDSGFRNNFMKVKKDHTTYFTDLKFENKEMSGIFVDIFPVDRVPDSSIGKKMQFVASALNLLFTRGYTSGSKGIKGTIERTLLKLPRKNQIKIRNKTELYKRRWNSTGKGEYVNASTIEESAIYYPPNMFDEFVDVEFNGKLYKAVSCYDEFLTRMYGDYMKLPPESERVWGHMPKVLSFDKNYSELQEGENVLS